MLNGLHGVLKLLDSLLNLLDSLMRLSGALRLVNLIALNVIQLLADVVQLSVENSVFNRAVFAVEFLVLFQLSLFVLQAIDE